MMPMTVRDRKAWAKEEIRDLILDGLFPLWQRTCEADEREELVYQAGQALKALGFDAEKVLARRGLRLRQARS